MWAEFRHPVPCESLEPPTWEPLWLMLPSSNENTQEQKLLERWERKRKGNAVQFMTTHPLLVYMDRGSCVSLLQYGGNVTSMCAFFSCPGAVSSPFASRPSIDAWGSHSFRVPQTKVFCGGFCLGSAACYSPLVEIHSEHQQLLLRLWSCFFLFANNLQSQGDSSWVVSRAQVMPYRSWA